LWKQQETNQDQAKQRVQSGLQRTQQSKRERLDTSDLKAAGLDTSANPMLITLWESVVEYNTEWTHPTKLNDEQVVHTIGTWSSSFSPARCT
jgi:hypothetical protein